jgi:hypothetical protein
MLEEPCLSRKQVLQIRLAAKLRKNVFKQAAKKAMKIRKRKFREAHKDYTKATTRIVCVVLLTIALVVCTIVCSSKVGKRKSERGVIHFEPMETTLAMTPLILA